MPKDQRYKAVYLTTPDDWARINTAHSGILAGLIGGDKTAKVLDVGCGWGRLLELMPPGWAGDYFGVDLSPDFIALARTEHRCSRVSFACGAGEAVLPTLPYKAYDWAVFVSIKHMLIRNGQQAVWDVLEREAKRVAKSVLLLEYDHTHPGDVL